MGRKGADPGFRYFNVIPDYIPVLERCVKEKHWIRNQGMWWAPYDWAAHYGVSWKGNNWQPYTRSPYELLQEGIDVVEAKIKAGADPEYISVLRNHCSAFEKRINEYYASGKDEMLIQSMQRGVWIK